MKLVLQHQAVLTSLLIEHIMDHKKLTDNQNKSRKASRVNTRVGSRALKKKATTVLNDNNEVIEPIKLNLEKSPLLNPNSGVVVDSKFLGNSAIIHMTVNDEKNNKHHIHSRVMGNFLPPAASSVSVTLDEDHIFIFPR